MMFLNHHKDNHLLVYVQGTFANRQSGELLEGHPSGRFKVTQQISIADVVVWTGGEDINPSLYGEPKLPCTQGVKFGRDAADLAAVKISKDKIKIGLCRGAQLLNVVVGGGKMWQDVDNHGWGDHECTDYVTSKTVKLNSLHHQMMIPGPTGMIVCGTMIANEKLSYETTWVRAEAIKNWHDRSGEFLIDPEVIWYKKEKALCVQSHPEFAHDSTRKYFYELVDRYILAA